jgi:hypothetical protein
MKNFGLIFLSVALVGFLLAIPTCAPSAGMKAGLAIAELDRNDVINRAALKKSFPELEAGDMRFNVRKYVTKESTDTISQLCVAGVIVCAVAIVTILVERRTRRTKSEGE